MTICSRSCVERQTKVGRSAPAVLAIFLLLATAAAYAQDQSAPAAQPAPAPGQGSDAVPSSAPAPVNASSSAQNESRGVAPLRVMVSKSMLLKLPSGERVTRVVVTDPNVASVMPLSPGNQILVNGLTAGEVSLIIWDEYGREEHFDLRVDVDVTSCAEEEKEIFPDEQIHVTSSRSAIVLSGHVSTKDVAEHAEKVALAYSAKVVNVLSSGPIGSQEILLKVTFAEVDRTALTQLGANLLLPGQGHTIALSQTQQFGGVTVTNSAQTTTTNGNSTTTTQTPTAPTANISNFLNLFIFRQDINFGAVIQALQEKNLLQILAEPSIVAMNGKEAKFKEGGQFPFPVVQPGQGFTAVTITFKDFGVLLNFTPEIMPNGNIHLKVAPEVSTLDFTNALTISGFTVPALATRSAETEFELQDGQSFVIAGLIDNRVTDIVNKIPGLGDIPVLGNFFKSKSAQKNRTELMVLCTVRKIDATSQPPVLPTQPEPFLDKNQFDRGKTPKGGK